MLTSTMLRTSSSSSTVASSGASSASTRFVITSTTLKRRGPVGSTGLGGRGLRSRTTLGAWPPFIAAASASSRGRISAPVPFVSVSRTQTFPIGIKSRKGAAWRLQLCQHLVDGLQEPVVLRPGAVRDAEVALVTERLAAADDHAALGEALHDRGLVAFAERDPGEVRLAVGRLEAALAELLLHVQALDRGALDAGRDLVLVLEGLDRRRQRQRVDAERLPHEVDGAPEVVAARERVAHAQPAQPVHLRERAQQDEVRVLLQQGQRVVRVLQRRELDVRLVEEDRHVPRQRPDEL